MYDVLYSHHPSPCTVLASCTRREEAIDVARAEARRRHLPRMFLTGSPAIPFGDSILIIRSGP
jgi:hypothetical protein